MQAIQFSLRRKNRLNVLKPIFLSLSTWSVYTLNNFRTESTNFMKTSVGVNLVASTSAACFPSYVQALENKTKHIFALVTRTTVRQLIRISSNPLVS